MTAPSSVSNADLERAYFLAAVPAADNNLAVAMGQGVVTTPRQASLQANSQLSSAHLNAPAAGAAIVTVNIPANQGGYYQVDISVGFGATAESTAIDNFIFQNNSVTVGNGVIPVANVANTMSEPFRVYAEVTGGTSIWVNANVAGSAGSVYKASIIATRIA